MAERESTTGTTRHRTNRVSISFAAAEYDEIKKIAKDKRVSTAWVVRDAVTSYLDARTPLFARDRRGERPE